VTDALLPWLPAFMVVLLGSVALIAAAAAATPAARRIWLGVIATVAALTLAATLWQAWAAGHQIVELTKHDQSKELAAQVKSLKEQVVELQESTRVRSLGADAATKLTGFLRQFGGHKVVVSCAPNDIEAYQYASQIANVLKAANWDARGPETTTIFGDVRAMAINVYDNGGRASDTAKILLDALAKAGIPYQSRVPPSEAMPADEAVELFIGAKPGQPATAAGGTAH
jgi:hypothetical protein